MLHIMSSKANSVCKTVAPRNNKNTLEKYKQPLPTFEVPVEGPVSVDNYSTLTEVTVKIKGRKRTSTMVSSSPTSQKAIEEKRKPSGSGDSHHSWGRILREENRPIMKQGLQQLAMRTQCSKSVKHGTESKDTKKQKDTSGHQKYELTHKHLDEIPVKQTPSQRRAEEHAKLTSRRTNPSTTSMTSSIESIIVVDRGVQCGGIFDYPNDRFGVFNPVRTLGFLMKELEHLVKDEKASKILTDMEQALFRIPMEPGKPTSVDLEAIALRTKLEASTIQLEETSRKMNAMCEALREERDSLQRQVHKQGLLLNEARERKLDLEANTKALKQELEKALKTAQSKEKVIAELREEIKGYEFSQKVIADLRTNLNEQTELARQRHLEMQYLTLEKEKLSVLSSYKDSLLVELRNAVKELQNHIADQLTGLKDVYVHEESSNPQISLVHGGLVCSSPTSTSSRESNLPTSWHDISDVSLSTVEHSPCKDRNIQSFLLKTENTCENLEKKRNKSIKESKLKDSAQLEFISLPAGEFSHTNLLSHYKDTGCSESTQVVTKEKTDMILFDEKKNDNLHESNNVDTRRTSSEYLHQFAEKTNDKAIDARDSSKLHKSSGSSKKQSFGKKSTASENTSNILNSNSNLIGPSITEQFQNIFEDMRLQSRMPVNVPSPARNYPQPDLSDSTLLSISAASELNVLQSNDT